MIMLIMPQALRSQAIIPQVPVALQSLDIDWHRCRRHLTLWTAGTPVQPTQGRPATGHDPY